MKHIYIFIALIFITLSACSQQAESKIQAEEPTNLSYTTELVVPELKIPWGMAFLPDGSILITEKEGQLIHFKDNEKIVISGFPEVYLRGQGGLMDIKLQY